MIYLSVIRLLSAPLNIIIQLKKERFSNFFSCTAYFFSDLSQENTLLQGCPLEVERLEFSVNKDRF